ncbi:LysM peptidoglycan-binding domain-containing protein [Paenibacillus silviterrae]|uniref:LysM peptidoglycan-binding domain-containing protein n=1 Tax=Paenibacillus silviterrae TaxID=3242194 RepID=UPI002543C9BF|nr:LysM peptidoglycan-binding domain-containing protein [Paenibacillus chinjuensis]
MTNGQSGLRFDIYERVQLNEGVAPIRELEGVELTPHIQVIPQGEQALLRGNLLLSGTYVDDQERGDQTLEHLIPVEITLPLSRVQRVEDISVEIENFDVDLLSSRSLNITGVLSLNGVELASAPEESEWREQEEEVVFIHEAAAPEKPQQEIVAPAEPAAREQESAFSAWTTPAEVREEFVQEEAPVGAEAPEEIAADDVIDVGAEAEELEEEEAITVAAAPAQDEKKEMKIAFGSKNGTVPLDVPASAPATSGSFGLTTLLKKATSGNFEPRQQESAVAAPEAPVEKVEWKKLLLSSMNENQEFRRVRMYIVQKDDTLETIAKRYELNPREIALFNRLGDSEVSAGQIVYIPKS